MARLIDVDALLEKMKGTPRYFDVKHDIEEMPTISESGIRAKAIDEFAEKLIELFCYEAPIPNKWKMDNIYEGESIRKIITEVAEQLKESE